jgi:hypothetical protein
MKVSPETFVHEPMVGELSGAVSLTLSIRNTVARYWHWAAAVALAILLWAPRLSGPIDLRWDASVYYVLGTSLATGHGYRILSEPGSPESLQYPPLLPAIVALCQRVLGSTNPAIVAPRLRILYAALFVIYALTVLALAKRYLGPMYAIGATALCLLQPSTIFVSDALFTEIPFAVLSVLFLLVANGGRFQWPRFCVREAAAFALATTAFLLRNAGIALFAAWAIQPLMQKRWRLALVRVVLALLPLAIWQAYVERVHRSEEYHHPAYTYQRAPYQVYNVSYADNALLIDPSRPELGYAGARALTWRVIRNFPRVAKAAGEAVSANDFYWRQTVAHFQQRLLGHQIVRPGIVIAPILALLGLTAIGLVMLARRGAWLIVLYTVGSIGLICTTPWSFQFQRYVTPLAPFLAIAAIVAVSGIISSLRSLRVQSIVLLAGRVALTGLLGLIFLVQVYTAWLMFQERVHARARFVPGTAATGAHFFHYDVVWRGWDQAIAWIEQHAPPGTVVATLYSHLCYLRTGLHAVSLPVERDPARARELLESVPVSYVIVDGEWLLPTVESDSVDWRLVQSFEGTKLYERKAPAQTR